MHMITSQIKIWNYDNFGAQAGQRHSSTLNMFKIYGFDHSKQMKMAKHVILPRCNK